MDLDGIKGGRRLPVDGGGGVCHSLLAPASAYGSTQQIALLVYTQEMSSRRDEDCCRR